MSHLGDILHDVRLFGPDRKRLQIIDRDGLGLLAWCPRDVRVTDRHLVRTNHAEPRTAVDAQVDTLVPYRIVTEFKQYSCSKRERLGATDLRFRPMDVDTALHTTILLGSEGRARHDTLARNDRAHQLKRLQKLIVAERFGVPPIEIDKEPKHLRLLFDDVHLFTSAQHREILEHEGIRVLVRHVENAAIHEIVRTWSLADFPFGESHKHMRRLSLIWQSSPGPSHSVSLSSF